MAKTVLILGATGGFGGAAARQFSAEGWQVRALHRDPARAAQRQDLPRGIAWRGGDAMNAAEVCAAAMGADIRPGNSHEPVQYVIV